MDDEVKSCITGILDGQKVTPGRSESVTQGQPLAIQTVGVTLLEKTRRSPSTIGESTDV
ncbi:MAG: hypothetical protein WHV61_01080 [Burkholderiales bacterium]